MKRQLFLCLILSFVALNLGAQANVILVDFENLIANEKLEEISLTPGEMVVIDGGSDICTLRYSRGEKINLTAKNVNTGAQQFSDYSYDQILKSPVYSSLSVAGRPACSLSMRQQP